MPELTHHESHVLALIRKWQPTTAYFVRKTLARGLATTHSSSPGSIYPIIERLKRRGLVQSAPVSEDGRGTEQLECTADGEAAIQSWICEVAPADLLPEDPWRTRIAFADLVPPESLLGWLFEIRSAAGAQEAALAAPAVEGDLGMEAALENARMLNAARLAWAERVITRIVAQR